MAVARRNCPAKRAPGVMPATVTTIRVVGNFFTKKPSTRFGSHADNPLDADNRGIHISDNLPFLRSLNDGSIDLVCIASPLADDETNSRKNHESPAPLKPTLVDEERATELELRRLYGIRKEPAESPTGLRAGSIVSRFARGAYPS